MKINKNFIRVTAVFFVFYLGFAGYYFKRIYQPWGTCDTDFTVFTRAAEQIAQKQNLYQDSYLETGRDFYKYSPAFAAFMVPLSKLHRHLSVPIWYFSIFIFFMAAIFLVQKILHFEDKNRVFPKSFYILGILCTLRFLLSVVQRVQSDCLVLFLLALFAYALFCKKDLLAGVCLATSVMVKLTPLIFLPWLLLRRRWRAFFSGCAFTLSYLLAPALYVGVDRNFAYLKNWLLVHQKNPADYLVWYKNQSLLSFLLRFFNKDSALALFNLSPALIYAIFLLLAVILFALIFILGRRPQENPSGFFYLLEYSLVLICMILFSPLAWKHTFVHLIVVHLVILYYLLFNYPRDKITLGLLIFSFFLNTVLNPELTKPIAEQVQLYSSITWGTLLLYFALLRIKIKYANADHHPYL